MEIVCCVQVIFFFAWKQEKNWFGNGFSASRRPTRTHAFNSVYWFFFSTLLDCVQSIVIAKYTAHVHIEFSARKPEFECVDFVLSVVHNVSWYLWPSFSTISVICSLFRNDSEQHKTNSIRTSCKSLLKHFFFLFAKHRRVENFKIKTKTEVRKRKKFCSRKKIRSLHNH